MRLGMVLLTLFLGLVVIWAWVPALSVGFLADDYEWMSIVRQVELGDVWKLFLPRSIEPVRVMYRPLVGLLFWVDWRIWGMNPVGYHLTNLFFHSVLVVGVYFLARLLWGRSRQDGIPVGALAATLFAVNPLLPEAVTWVDGRYDVVASAFLVWSLVLFIWSLKVRDSLMILFVSLSLAFVSLLAKEIGLVYPFLVLTIMIYKDRDKNSTKWYDFVRRFIKRQRGQLLGAAGAVSVYLLVSAVALGRPFWQVTGYAVGISRPFLLWAILTILWLIAQGLRRKLSFGTGWLAWMLIGLSLLPVALLPTQLRFLYLPSAFTAIWLAAVVPDVLSRVGLSRLLLPAWIAVHVASASLLRLENLQWLGVSRLQRQTVSSIRRHLAEAQPQFLYIFNLPDHAGRVLLFRTYVAEAVLIGYQGVAQMTQEVQVIAGPKTVDLGESSLRVIDSRRLAVESNSGFVVFEPAIRQRFPDGSVEIAGEQWLATVSADRRQAEITLSSGLHEEGVLGLTFHLRGGILKTPRE